MMYASIGRRFLAVLLDAIFLFIPCWIANRIIPVAGSVFVTFVYFAGFEASEVRGTPGKYLVGVQVVDLSGGRIPFRAGVVRYFMKLISSGLAFIGHLFALFTERKQAFHDLIAETVVVYGRNEINLWDAWWSEMKSLFSSEPVAGRTSDGRDGERVRENVVSELERLQALREKGALTEEEFQAEKRRLLG